MTNPLPTSPEVEYAETVVLVNSGESLLLAHLQPLRAAQHAATRQAVLKEVYDRWLVASEDVDDFIEWLTNERRKLAETP